MSLGTLGILFVLSLQAIRTLAQTEVEGGNADTRLSLGETLVTPARAPSTAFEAPWSTEDLSASLLREQAVRSTPEAFQRLLGVMVQKTSHGQGSPYLRGFTGFRTVFLIDGIRLNHSAMRDGPNQYWSTVDALSVERFEVVRGPASVLWGSDAIGGTVHALTKGPYTVDGRSQADRFGGEAFYRVSSAEESHTGRIELWGRPDDRLGIFLGGSGKHFGDVRAGDGVGEQPNTGYDEWGVDLKLEHEVFDEHSLVMAFQKVRQNNVPRTHSTVFAQPFEGTTVGSDLRRDLDQERELTYVQLYGQELAGALSDYRLSLSWHEQSEVRDRIRGSGARDKQGFEVGTLGLLASASAPSSLGRLTFGVDYYRDDVDSFSSSNPVQGPVADEATYDMLGVFAQDELDVNDELSLVIAARFDHVALDADSVLDPVTMSRIDLEDDWSSVVGSVRFLYRLTPDSLHAFGGVSQGFRAPNLSDSTRFDSARTNEFEIPAPGLDPERFLSFELGLKQRGALQGRVASQIAVFYTDIEDQIVRVPTGNVNAAGEFEVTKSNVGDGYVYGVEAAASLTIDSRWSLFGSVAFVEGKVDTFASSAPVATEEFLDRLMPLTGRIGARWEEETGRSWGELALDLAADADRLSTRDEGDSSRIPPGGTPGFAVLHLRGGWRLSDRARIDVALENVFDEDHRIHGSGLNQPGRNLIVGLSFGF